MKAVIFPATSQAPYDLMTDQKTLIDLDFQKLIDRIAELALSLPGKQIIQSLQPYTDHQNLLDFLETVAEMRAVLESTGEDLPLDFLPIDEELALLRVHDTVLDGGSIRKIEKTVREARCLRESFTGRREASPRLWRIIREVKPLPKIEERIRSAIDESGEVIDSASDRLASLRRTFRESRERVAGLLEKIREKIGPEVDTLEGGVTIRNGRYVVPLRVSSRIKVQGSVHDRSRSGMTPFVGPQEATEPSKGFRDLELDIYREIHTILRGISSELRAVVEVLEADQAILGRIDAIQAIAQFAREYDCSLPEIAPDLPLRLVNARHPLLGKPPGGRVVPLDLTLEENERSLLVSGPNAGGKTVLLKTVGLLTLMTHYGIPPPLGDGSKIPFLDMIYTGIGDDQSIENDLSTFSSKVRILREILENADNRCMILLDEVGSGTDPTEGQALALAVIEELCRRGSLNIFTTHYAEVKGIVGVKEEMVNGAMCCDPVKVERT